jgi:ADP-heptose:LPS heptosyltransferase
LQSYADTAAVIMNLDVVVSVDTSVAHLAGALAKPVWIMLPFACDWRWFDRRDDSPWYPTARLYRQPRRTDWAAVVSNVRDALADMTARRK